MSPPLIADGNCVKYKTKRNKTNEYLPRKNPELKGDQDIDLMQGQGASVIGPCSVAPSPGVADRGGCIRSGEDLEV